MLDKVAFDSLSIEPAGRTGDRLQFAGPYLKALAIYLCSRLVVFFGVMFGKAYIALGNDDWVAGRQWYHRLLRWDSEWYKIIASEGYSYDGDPHFKQTVVFYPLYSTLCRLVSEVLRIDVVDAMLLVANLAGLAVATRSSGIVLFPVLLWELWRCRSPRRFLIEAVPLSIIASSGLWLFIIYLGFAFGHP